MLAGKISRRLRVLRAIQGALFFVFPVTFCSVTLGRVDEKHEYIARLSAWIYEQRVINSGHKRPRLITKMPRRGVVPVRSGFLRAPTRCAIFIPFETPFSR